MGWWEKSLVAGSKLWANRKFPITPELTDYWQHQKQPGPPTSHVSLSEERVGLASWHTNKHTYTWGPYRFVLRRHGASFPACLPSIHPLSLHYSTTDPLMVNVSDTDAAEKCWQHKSLSAGNWTRWRFALPPYTQRPNKSFQVCVGYFPDVTFDKRWLEHSSDLQKFCFCWIPRQLNICVTTPPSLGLFLFETFPLLCFIWMSLLERCCLGSCRDLFCLKQRLSVSQTQRRGRVVSCGGSFQQNLWGRKDLFKARCLYCFYCRQLSRPGEAGEASAWSDRERSGIHRLVLFLSGGQT